MIVRRKKYLINRSYQFGMLIVLVIIIFIVILISILSTHYYLLSSVLDTAYQTGRFPAGQELIEASTKPFTIIVPIIFIILVFVVVYIIYVSHRTAGPLHHLKEAMDKVGEGDFSVKVKFRKNDEIHDVADSFNKMVQALRKKYGEK